MRKKGKNNRRSHDLVRGGEVTCLADERWSKPTAGGEKGTKSLEQGPKKLGSGDRNTNRSNERRKR